MSGMAGEAPPARRRPRIHSAVVGVGFVAAVLTAWQLATVVFDIPHFILPSPSEIVRATWDGREDVVTATGATAQAVMVGFVVGNLAGFLGAIVVAASASAARLLMPLALGVRSVPIIALAPFLTLYLGRGFVAITTVTALIVFFPTLINGILGLRSVDPRSVELMDVLSASRAQRFVRLHLPAALPSLFSALRIAAPSAVLGAMVAEWVVSGDGLGYLILSSSIASRTALMWGAVMVSTLVAGIAFTIVAAIERRAIPWSADQFA